MEFNNQKSSFRDCDLNSYDVVSYGINGVYQVERIEDIKVGSSSQKYYLLSHLYSKTPYKTFVCQSKGKDKGLRRIVSKNNFEKFMDNLDKIEVTSYDINGSSTKKMLAYEQLVNDSFEGALKAYFGIKFDLKQSQKDEKRLHFFKEKLEKSLVEEVASCLHLSLEEAQNLLEKKTILKLSELNKN